MNYKIILTLWFILSASLVYWDIHRWEEIPPVSICHEAEVRMVNGRPMCIGCNKFCNYKKVKESK